jgi:hypothetical protein
VYSRPRCFREQPDQWLKLVRALWPGCPAHVTSDGRHLAVERANSLPERIGVPS